MLTLSKLEIVKIFRAINWCYLICGYRISSVVLPQLGAGVAQHLTKMIDWEVGRILFLPLSLVILLLQQYKKKSPTLIKDLARCDGYGN